jgi:hypothetical protein
MRSGFRQAVKCNTLAGGMVVRQRATENRVTRQRVDNVIGSLQSIRF